MIRIQGIPIVAARLQRSHRAASQPAGHAFPCKGGTAANIVQAIERQASLPPGTEDRFAEYTVIGLPFRSGTP
jgi:hypothetical protein